MKKKVLCLSIIIILLSLTVIYKYNKSYLAKKRFYLLSVDQYTTSLGVNCNNCDIDITKCTYNEEAFHDMKIEDENDLKISVAYYNATYNLNFDYKKLENEFYTFINEDNPNSKSFKKYNDYLDDYTTVYYGESDFDYVDPVLEEYGLEVFKNIAFGYIENKLGNKNARYQATDEEINAGIEYALQFLKYRSFNVSTESFKDRDIENIEVITIEETDSGDIENNCKSIIIDFQIDLCFSFDESISDHDIVKEDKSWIIDDSVRDSIKDILKEYQFYNIKNKVSDDNSKSIIKIRMYDDSVFGMQYDNTEGSTAEEKQVYEMVEDIKKIIENDKKNRNQELIDSSLDELRELRDSSPELDDDH